MNWSSHIRKGSLATMLLLALAGEAAAQVNYGNFNIIVANNATFQGGAHVHRAGYIGGNLSATVNEVSFNQDHLDNSMGLAVFGNVASNSKLSLFGGNYYMPGETIQTIAQPANPVSDVVLTDGTTIKSAATKLTALPTGGSNAAGLNTPSDFFGRLGQESSRLAGLATTLRSNGANPGDPNNSPDSNPNTLDFIRNSDKIIIQVVTGQTNVLNLGYNTFAGVSEVNFSGFDANTKLVINYFANSWNNTVTLNFKTLGLGSSYSDQVLWNIRETQNLIIGNGSDTWHGSILATQTNITWQANDMDGQFIAKSLTDSSNNEFHNYMYFSGDLPPIPEPSTYGLLGAAACGAFAMIRRRTRSVRRSAA